MTALLLLAAADMTFLENHFAQQWFAVRSGTATAEYARAVQLVQGEPGESVSRAAMAVLDGLAATSRNAEEFVLGLGRVPDRPEFATPKRIAKSVAGEIMRLGPDGRERLIEHHKPAIDKARAMIEDEFRKNPGLVDQAADDLGIKSEKNPVIVLLVPDAPSPGAATYRSIEGPICVIGVKSFKEGELLEAVLHEAAHALDERHRGAGHALDLLRKKLTEAGVEGTSPLMRDVPHAVIFATAAQRVSMAKGKGYVPFGVAHGAYERMGKTMTVVNEVWARRVRGDIILDQAIDEIVRRTVVEPGRLR